jgi:type I restriction enzyme, S subunit
MSIPRYERYEESGVAWLGEVPQHWHLRPFWTCFRREKRTDFPEEELLSVYREYGVVRKSDRDDNHNNPSEDLSAYQLVEPDDLVVNKMKAWQGSVAISPYRGIVSPAYFVYRPRHNESSRFLHYLMRSPGYTAGYLSLSKGIRIGQWDLDPIYHSRMPLLLPPEIEQEQIARFLDGETARIDVLIEEQRRLIALLKEKRQAVISHAVTKGLNSSAPMNHSGVEWIGFIPIGWRVTRLKMLADVRGGITKNPESDADGKLQVPYLRVANVQDGYLDLNEVVTIGVTADELERYRLLVGDVLMNEGGDFDKLGRGAIWNGEIADCIHQNHVFSVRPSVIESEWLTLVTSAECGKFYFMSRSKQSTNLASISRSNIRELPVPCPSAKERKEILRYVHDQLKRLEHLVEQASNSIKLLEEHRSALISDAVTGKIDVRGLAANTAEVPEAAYEPA